MHQSDRSLHTLLGLVIWGDLGPVTMYRSHRGKVVAYAKTWPKKPPSAAQQAQRDKLTDAAAAWHALTPEQRAQWHLASRRASLCMHGYDLWVHYQLTTDAQAIQTLQRQTHTTLLPP